jgi:hypothetical protein
MFSLISETAFELAFILIIHQHIDIDGFFVVLARDDFPVPVQPRERLTVFDRQPVPQCAMMPQQESVHGGTKAPPSPCPVNADTAMCFKLTLDWRVKSPCASSLHKSILFRISKIRSSPS